MDFAGGVNLRLTNARQEVNTKNHSQKRVDEALRLLLESFRLPGESQQIARIMEVFAETYFAVISRMISVLVD